MRTTISICSTGSESTGSNGRAIGARRTVSIATAPGSTWCPGPTSLPTRAADRGFVRPLAQTARQMGIEILLQQQMTKIHCEEPVAGRVIGIAAVEVDNRYQPLSRS